MITWKVPISTQHPMKHWVSHLMPNTKKTDTMFKTPCGMKVNPGFAQKPNKTTMKCKKCERHENP